MSDNTPLNDEDYPWLKKRPEKPILIDAIWSAYESIATPIIWVVLAITVSITFLYIASLYSVAALNRVATNQARQAERAQVNFDLTFAAYPTHTPTPTHIPRSTPVYQSVEADKEILHHFLVEILDGDTNLYKLTVLTETECILTASAQSYRPEFSVLDNMDITLTIVQSPSTYPPYSAYKLQDLADWYFYYQAKGGSYEYLFIYAPNDVMRC